MVVGVVIAIVDVGIFFIISPTIFFSSQLLSCDENKMDLNVPHKYKSYKSELNLRTTAGLNVQI